LLFGKKTQIQLSAYVSKSIGTASGILIQFPLYAGIMGIIGLKAKEKVPYTFVLFLVGGVVFALLLF